MRLIRARRFTLMEVVLAIAILSLSLLPLLYPHFAILREEQRFVREIDLDRKVNLLWADDLQTFFSGNFSWESEWDVVREVGSGAKRRVHKEKSKSNETVEYMLILVEYTMTLGKKKQVYPFYATVQRNKT